MLRLKPAATTAEWSFAEEKEREALGRWPRSTGEGQELAAVVLVRRSTYPIGENPVGGTVTSMKEGKVPSVPLSPIRA